MSKALKITGIVLLVLVVFGAAAFAGISFVSAQQQPGSSQPAAPAEKGLVVVQVEADSPAARAGVARGDILLKLNDTETNTPADLKTALAALKAGDSVKLSVTHGDAAKTLTAALIDKNGKPYLGLIVWGNVTVDKSKVLPNKPSVTLPAGAILTNVVEKGPADAAGLKKGDVILAVNGKDLAPQNDLAGAIQALKPGDKVTLKVATGSSQRDVTVTLGDKDGKAYLGVEYQAAGMWQRGGSQGNVPPFGKGMPFDKGKGNSLPGKLTGVLVQQVVAGSPAEKAGLKVRQVITKVDGKDVANADALIQAIAARKPGDTVTLTVQTGRDASTAADLKVTLGENPQAAGKAFLGIQVVDLTGIEFTPPDITPAQPAGPQSNS